MDTAIPAFNDNLKTLCSGYNINVFDLYNESGINESNWSTYLLPDKIHPNSAGVTQLKTKWLTYLHELLNK
jgi:lysophospholipase L1-like esterase